MSDKRLTENETRACTAPFFSSLAGKSDVKQALNGMLSIFALVFFDLLAVGISFLLAYAVRNHLLVVFFPKLFPEAILPDTYRYLWWVPFIILFFLAFTNLYHKRLPYWDETEKIIKASTLSLLFVIAFLYLAKIGSEVSRTYVLLIWFFSIFALPLFRYYGKLFLRKINIWNRPALLVGYGEPARLVISALSREKTIGYEVLGIIDYGYKKSDREYRRSQVNCIENIPVLGCAAEAEQIIASSPVQDIVVATSGLKPETLVNLTNRLQPLVRNVFLVPELLGLSLQGIEIKYFFEEQVLLLHIKNRFKSTSNRVLKRIFDLMAGSLVFLFFVPVIMVVALSIKLDSLGQVFFVQRRLGRNGMLFNMIKFRTMFQHSDVLLHEHLQQNTVARAEWQQFNKLITYDPRLTPVGRVLRTFSIDELPQIINVIKGEMSLVGPRPYLPSELEQMGSWAHDILLAKPGLTGLWQVSGRNKISFAGRLKLDSWYVKNLSLWLDLVLLLKTIRVVFNREGAY